MNDGKKSIENKSEAKNLKNMVGYQEGSVVSREIARKKLDSDYFRL